MKKLILLIIILKLSFTLLGQGQGLSEEEYYNFHSNFAGIWDRNHEFESGYEIPMSWGRASYGNSTLILIDFLDKNGELDNNSLIISNESYLLKDFNKINENEYLVFLEEEFNFDPVLETGYFLFTLINEGSSIKISSLYDIDPKILEDLRIDINRTESSNIPLIEKYTDIILYKRSGP